MSKIPAQGDVDVSKTSLWYIVSINSPDILLYPSQILHEESLLSSTDELCFKNTHTKK